MYNIDEINFADIYRERKKYVAIVLDKKDEVLSRLNMLKSLTDIFAENEKVNFYWNEGCIRRINYIITSATNIFNLIVPKGEYTLEGDWNYDDYDLPVIELNFQNFIINISGIFDDIAWMINYLNKLNLNKRYITLEGKVIKSTIELQYPTYSLFLPKIKKWNLKYKKKLRDPICHRIPLKIVRQMTPSKKKRYYKLLEEKSRYKLDYFINFSFLSVQVVPENLDDKKSEFLLSLQLVNDLLTISQNFECFLKDTKGRIFNDDIYVNNFYKYYYPYYDLKLE